MYSFNKWTPTRELYYSHRRWVFPNDSVLTLLRNHFRRFYSSHCIKSNKLPSKSLYLLLLLYIFSFVVGKWRFSFRRMCCAKVKVQQNKWEITRNILAHRKQRLRYEETSDNFVYFHEFWALFLWLDRRRGLHWPLPRGLRRTKVLYSSPGARKMY